MTQGDKKTIVDSATREVKEPPSYAKCMWHKIKKNPLIPVGLSWTMYYLIKGLLNMGDPKQSQLMMRRRVLAQTFTFVVLLGGIFVDDYIQELREKRLAQQTREEVSEQETDQIIPQSREPFPN